MNTQCRLVVAGFVCLLAFGLVQSEIHRAKTLRAKSAVKSGRRLDSDAAPPRPDQPHRGAEGGHSSETWIYSLLSASLIGLSGVFPLLVIPLEAGDSLKTGGKLSPGLIKRSILNQNSLLYHEFILFSDFCVGRLMNYLCPWYCLLAIYMVRHTVAKDL